mmetsp:Transcript_9286/g.38079  ORF Transcript_9286/g.38079 Transcript_9286/m.38079 type:complete len:613 (-) Transcript_9286:1333-3171(-)
MEKSTVAGATWTRHNFSATIDARDLVDSYLKPFAACVERGRVSGLMCSYNEINGIPSCANSWLLEEVARGAWGFDGYVTSDCDAVADVYDEHHYHNDTPEETVRDVLRAGTDVDCESFVGDHGLDALEAGVIVEDDVDRALARLFGIRMRLGHFDVDFLEQHPYSKLAFDTDVCQPESTGLARNVVAQSVVLLANPRGMLPLTENPAKVAVVGPLANVSTATAEYYAGSPCFGDLGLLADVAAEVFSTASAVTYAPGLPNATGADEGLVREAADVASDADVVLLTLGTDLTMAMEGQDFADELVLPAAQVDLLDAVMAAASPSMNTTRTVVLLLFTATPLDISPVLDKYPTQLAVVHVGHPSVQTRGVLDVLVGAVAPAGRLVQTWYPSSYARQISIFDFNMRSGPSAWPRPDCVATPCANGTNPGRTYRFYDDASAPVVFEFGFGLSYTTFAYAPASGGKTSFTVNLDRALLVLRRRRNHATPTLGGTTTTSPPPPLSATDAVAIEVNVTNTGNVTAADAVLAFLVPPGAGRHGVPLKSLVSFERVSLRPRETTTVVLPITLDHFIDVLPRQRVGEDALVYSPRRGEYTVTIGVQGTSSGFLEDAFTIRAV